MFKKTAGFIACSLAISASSAWAANDANSLINITAVIPAKDFYAFPVEPEFGKNETMNYNLANGSLGSLRAMYELKNAAGSIQAYIDGGPAKLRNGNSTHDINLATSFNGVVLTAAPQEVVTTAQAATGTRAELVITPDTPVAAAAGTFTASLTVIFDNIPGVI